MKTISKKCQKREKNKETNNIKNLLIFKQRENYPNEFQLRIDNINKNLYNVCYPQWIKNHISAVDRIYMRIRKNDNKLTYELLFSAFKEKFSVDFEKFVAYVGNECYDYQTLIHYQYKSKIIELDKIDCNQLLENIFAELNKLNIEHNV